MISKADQTFLLKVARDAINSHPQDPPVYKSPPELDPGQGAFVTLHLDGELRGCIGRIVTTDAIIPTVQRCAVEAANADPRFPPVRREEIPQLHIEVSVLEKPLPLPHSTPQELLDGLSDDLGVILIKGKRSATFLPQVWEELPDKVQFLGYLSMKAGLPMDAWKDGVQIETYRVQSFGE